MIKKLPEILGWYGVAAILSAYLLNSLNIIKSTDSLYILLNLTGALGIVIDAWKQKNYQPVVLNVIWALVAVISLFRIFS